MLSWRHWGTDQGDLQVTIWRPSWACLMAGYRYDWHPGESELELRLLSLGVTVWWRHA